MAKLAKLLQAAAGAAGGGAGLNVEEVFSTYLYEGNGSTQTITNGIDLDGEGGLVWIKRRDGTSADHILYDTQRGVYKAIKSNLSQAESTRYSSSTAYGLGAFNSDGFTLGSYGFENGNGNSQVSWTFRKAPKFFTCLTYSGTGTAQNISHNLGSVPGCIIVKSIDDTRDWAVYHRGADATAPEDKYLFLNSTSAAQDNSSYWSDTAPTSTEFTVGNDSNTNGNGNTYVAYLFAHNDGDGEFGPTGDQDIIKCGSYTGNGGKQSIDLGFEPQWLLIRKTNGSEDWHLMDVMRGMPVEVSGSPTKVLEPNDSAAEIDPVLIYPYANGFTIDDGNLGVNGSGDTYIYIAIRRGPMAVPESASEVFAQQLGSNSTNPSFTSNFPVDMGFFRNTTASYDTRLSARLMQGKYLSPTNNAAESANSSSSSFDFQDGYSDGLTSLSTFQGWMWRRAPSFFDVVTGPWADGTSIKHNLGVTPELLIKKTRTGVNNWYVWTTGFGSAYYLNLDSTSEKQNNLGNLWGTIDNTQIVNLNYGITTESIFFLFASLDGVSKVGSYTGNGTSQNIDCGFSSGARFILIKRTDSTGDWYVWDTERGIVSGNDPHLSLNTNAAEVTTDDSIDPVSSGFAVNQVAATNINVSSASYIFYAIA